MAKTETTHQPSTPGQWPNGEPKSVRDAADGKSGGSK